MGYMKPRCRINSISHGWLLDQAFYSIERHILAKTRFKELFSDQSWDMEIYPMAIGQSEWDKFYGDRINYISDLISKVLQNIYEMTEGT